MENDELGEYGHVVPAMDGLEEETVGVVMLRLLVAKAQNDLPLQDLQIRRLTAGGPDALLEAVKRISFDFHRVMELRYGDQLEGRLLAILHGELDLT